MLFTRLVRKPTLTQVAEDLQSAVDLLNTSPDRIFTKEELKLMEDYVAERAKHLKYLRKQAI